MTPTNTEALAARLESGWCPIESPTDMERAAAELRRLSAENVAAVSSFLSADDERRELRTERDALRAALVRVREDVNWMLNTGQFLNPEVFEYLDAAMKGTQ